MTTPHGLPDDIAGRRFAAMGFGLHYRNMRFMTPRDIILPSIGGAGSSLLGNILLHLGLAYVDPTKEELLPDGGSVVPTDAVSRRVRTVAAAARSSRKDGSTGPEAERRFMKTHLPAEEYDGVELGGVWLLVRDPRDALYSWYRYHRGFAESEWEKVPDDFADFLARPFFTERPPVGTWCSFYRGWLRRAEQLPHVVVLRFEDLKTRPVEVMGEALASCGAQVGAAELESAIRDSSFQSMRRHEENVVAGGGRDLPEARVMRSGKVGEWEEWMSPRLEPFFDDEELRSVATVFGYHL